MEWTGHRPVGSGENDTFSTKGIYSKKETYSEFLRDLPFHSCDLYIVNNATYHSRSLPKDAFIVRLGEHNKSTVGDTNATDYRVASITAHPNYKPRSNHDSDIALLKLEGKITYSPDVYPIHLPEPGTVLWRRIFLPPVCPRTKLVISITKYGKVSSMDSSGGRFRIFLSIMLMAEIVDCGILPFNLLLIKLSNVPPLLPIGLTLTP